MAQNNLKNPFGSAGVAPAGGGFSFGQSFGAPATSGAGMFGSAAPAVAPSFGSAAPAVAPSFGSGGMFGSTAAAAPATSGAGMFGSAAPAVAPSFGSAAPAVAPSFGSGGMFGSTAPAASAPAVAPSFGSAAPAVAPSFGSGGMFGSTTAAAPATSGAGMFGSAAPAVAPSFGSGGMFGSTTAAAPAPGAPSGFPSFGKPIAAASGFGFNAVSAVSTAPTTAFGVSGGQNPSTSTAPAAIGSTSVPAISGFSLPLVTTAPAAAQASKAVTAAPGSLQMPALGGISAPAANSVPTLTGFGVKPIVAATTVPTAPVVTATPTVAPPAKAEAGLAAAATGGIPLLKNKTLEDILNKWTSDLEVYTQEFRSQATELQKWDRTILENGATEIDQNLEYIEAQQNELEATLDSYQAQVLALSQSDAQATQFRSSPADNEREKAYTLAENLNKQLDDMSLQLTVIIDDMNASRNAASSGGTSGGGGAVGSKPVAPEDDNPISAIVHILNDHLASLEWIDKTSNDLASRVVELKRISGMWVNSRATIFYNQPPRNQMACQVLFAPASHQASIMDFNEYTTSMNNIAIFCQTSKRASVFLESIEVVEAPFVLKSKQQTSAYSHEDVMPSCIVVLSIHGDWFSRSRFPPTATADFQSTAVSMHWSLRVEFVTGIAGQMQQTPSMVDEGFRHIMLLNGQRWSPLIVPFVKSVRRQCDH
ncbi:hypothetical protein BASA81_017896 [Batrachochytrium salamandrivorans]|nr:hypothetical protein BASA81_017896 [Batrachochytrium salamandrivorans]